VAYLPSDPNNFVFANESPSLMLVFIGVGLAIAAFIFI
jgi:hypothetical protein